MNSGPESAAIGSGPVSAPDATSDDGGSLACVAHSWGGAPCHALALSVLGAYGACAPTVCGNAHAQRDETRM